MRALVLAVLLSFGCEEVTRVEPDRLPPPVRTITDEGTLEDRTDDCGALDVEPPTRLSATPGPSDGVRMAVLARPGEDLWVGAAWVEHGWGGEYAHRPAVVFQILLDDGIPAGEPRWVDAPAPMSVDVARVPNQSNFVVAFDDAEDGTSLFVEPAIPAIPSTLAVGDFVRPSLVVLQDSALVAGLGPENGSDSNRRIEMAVIWLSGEGDAQAVPQTLGAELWGHTVVLASSGAEVWLAWRTEVERQDWLAGALLTYDPEGGWLAQLGMEQPLPELGERGPLPLRRVQNTPDLSVLVEQPGLVEVWQLTAGIWLPAVGKFLPPDEAGHAAATVGESGARWAVARSWAALDGTPREIGLQRSAIGSEPCATRTECVRVTTDARPSSAPEIVWTGSGYLVAWSDEVEGQTDVFVTHARCRPTASTAQP